MWKDAPLPYQDHGKQNSKMACGAMAILRKMQNDAAGLIIVLFFLAQQKTLILLDIAILLTLFFPFFAYTAILSPDFNKIQSAP
jgi:hypothetical protein